jgi:hypothetical protein
MQVSLVNNKKSPWFLYLEFRGAHNEVNKKETEVNFPSFSDCGKLLVSYPSRYVVVETADGDNQYHFMGGCLVYGHFRHDRHRVECF